MATPRTGVIIRDLYALAASQTEHNWQRLRDGVEICRLYQDGEDGPMAALLRYAPGARTPPHLHQGVEFIVVLSGAQADENGHYPAGSVLASPPGSTHGIVSDTGCVVLAIWHKPVKFL